MKIDELKRIAEENDYVLTKSFDNYKLKRKNRGNCIDISNVNANRVWISNISLCDDEDFKMIKAAVKFAETPLDEREEEKEYYLKHRWLRSRSKNMIVNKDCLDEYFLSDEFQSDDYQTQFTLKEIEEIKKKFDTDLADFELVEVGE